ncbi:MAG: pilus assembly protein [Pseudolabrys sp.]|nr:pilus assembly protein [Pseudolabrys sp.]MBV9259950.1 pilus assembly protein [Pseudolabrys sp.]
MLDRILIRIWRNCRSFAASKRANVAITFGIAAVPVAGLIGAALDFSAGNRAKAELDAIADAAALSAVSTNAMSQTASAAQDSAVAFFKAQATTNVKRGAYTTVNATVTDDSSGRTALVKYTGTVPTSVLGVVGIKQMNISGSSTAASAVPTYIDFYLLLDNTPSMGVGATPADVTTMVNNTPDQCAFACHEIDISPNDYYGLAKKLGVTMRIDVVRQATQQLMDTATNLQVVPSQFRMAIYTFGAAAENKGLTKIQSLSNSLSAAKSAASNVDLMTVPYQNYASDTDTDFGVFNSLNNVIANPGDGSSSGSPMKYVFFVSDGVADRAIGSPGCAKTTTAGQDPQTGTKYTRCQEPLQTSYCDTLKSRGIKIAVLYTTYLALPTNGWYMSWIDPFNAGPYGPSVNSEIAQNMQNCASPGLYFEVSPTQGISDAMTALFQKAVQQARLTR